MKISMRICREPLAPAPLPQLDFTPARNLNSLNLHRPRDKVVIILGATGTGKSRLSVDIATRFPAEIINSDKIQAHQGLDIVTNKITAEESCGVPHHLLGVLPPDADFSAANFRHMANLSVESVLSRRKLPVIVGGSNSYVEALVDDENCEFRSKYECCFLWVDVSMPVLRGFVSERVDKMVEKGMVEEVREIFDFSNSDYSRGIRKAIGVPELDWFFKAEQFLDSRERRELLRVAIEEIKKNTWDLACRQREKIQRLRKLKRWTMQRLDATSVFRLRRSKVHADVAWEKLVTEPTTDTVARFLLGGTTTWEREMARCLVA